MTTESVARTDSKAERTSAGASSRRLPRISFFSSVRFRLTAWYTLVLVIILTLLGVLLSQFMARALENEVDARLVNASRQIGDTKIYESGSGYVVDPGEDWVKEIERPDTPEFNAMLSAGLFVVIADFTSGYVDRGGNAPAGVVDAITSEDLIGPDTEFRNLSLEDHRVRIYTRPILLPSASVRGFEDRVVGVVAVGEWLDRQDEVLQLFNQLLRTAGAGGVLLATWGGWVLAGRALAPVNKITSTADAIARQGDAQESLSTRLDVNHTGDELARLSITFNDMLERIERAFLAQRRFVADASHELRTPLTAIRGNVDVLYRHAKGGRQIEPEMLQESLGDMKRESARMARLIDDLLLLARTDAEGLGHMVRPEPVSLDVIAQEAFRTAESIAKGQRLHLTIRQPLMIYGDGDRLVQVMIILLDNALRHTPAGGTVDLIIDAAETPDRRMTAARIQVVDSGEGIPPEHVPHLFERFYRVEGSRSRLAGGSGLGLAIALAIVRGHNGWIDVASPEGKGTHITVWLPILESPKGGELPLLPTGQTQDAPEA